MGTQRVEAFLQCNWLMETSDFALMMTICHRWNDHQRRDLDMPLPDLLAEMPYRDKKRSERSLIRSIKRLIGQGVLYVEHNGTRYVSDRLLHITIVPDKFWQKLKEIKERAKSGQKEKPVQARLLQSRAMKGLPESTRDEKPNLADERPSHKSTRDEKPNLADERASHSSIKSKDHTPKKDLKKAASLRGDIPKSGNYSAIAEIPAPEAAPRPALVPAAALTEPETAEAVFNTLELSEEAEMPSTDRTARLDEIRVRRNEIRHKVYRDIALREEERDALWDEYRHLKREGERIENDHDRDHAGAEAVQPVQAGKADNRVQPQPEQAGRLRQLLQAVQGGGERSPVFGGEEEAKPQLPAGQAYVPVLPETQDAAFVP